MGFLWMSDVFLSQHKWMISGLFCYSGFQRRRKDKSGRRIWAEFYSHVAPFSPLCSKMTACLHTASQHFGVLNSTSGSAVQWGWRVGSSVTNSSRREAFDCDRDTGNAQWFWGHKRSATASSQCNESFASLTFTVHTVKCTNLIKCVGLILCLMFQFHFQKRFSLFFLNRHVKKNKQKTLMNH